MSLAELDVNMLVTQQVVLAADRILESHWFYLVRDLFGKWFTLHWELPEDVPNKSKARPEEKGAKKGKTLSKELYTGNQGNIPEANPSIQPKQHDYHRVMIELLRLHRPVPELWYSPLCSCLPAIHYFQHYLLGDIEPFSPQR